MQHYPLEVLFMVLSVKNLYQELGFESLHDRCWCGKLFFYYKTQHNNCPFYLTNLLPTMETSCYSLRSIRPRTVLKVRTERFKSKFSSYYSFNWNQHGLNVQNSSSIEIFKRALLSFIRSNPAEV